MNADQFRRQLIGSVSTMQAILIVGVSLTLASIAHCIREALL